jgi:hypothetical protein
MLLDRLAVSKQNIGRRRQNNDPTGAAAILAAAAVATVATTTTIAAAIHAVEEVSFWFQLPVSPRCDPLLMFMSLEILKIISVMGNSFTGIPKGGAHDGFRERETKYKRRVSVWACGDTILSLFGNVGAQR